MKEASHTLSDRQAGWWDPPKSRKLNSLARSDWIIVKYLAWIDIQRVVHICDLTCFIQTPSRRKEGTHCEVRIYVWILAPLSSQDSQPPALLFKLSEASHIITRRNPTVWQLWRIWQKGLKFGKTSFVWNVVEVISHTEYKINDNNCFFTKQESTYVARYRHSSCSLFDDPSDPSKRNLQIWNEEILPSVGLFQLYQTRNRWQCPLQNQEYHPSTPWQFPVRLDQARPLVYSAASLHPIFCAIKQPVGRS